MYGSKFLSSSSIRGKLILLLLIILLPASAIIAASNLALRAQSVREAGERSLFPVRSLAAQQGQIAFGARQVLSTLALLPEVGNLDGTACNELFGEFVKNHPSYCFLGAAKPDGSVFASSAPFDPAVNLSDRKYFHDALATLDFSGGEYAEGETGGIAPIHFAYPVPGADNKPTAILFANIRLDDRANLPAKANPPADAAFILSDHKWIRLSGFSENEAAGPARPLPEDEFRRISGNRELGTFEVTSEDGVRRIYAFKQLRLGEGNSPYLYLLVGNPKDRIARTAGIEMLRNLSGLGVLGLFAMLLLWKSANYLLIRPIDRLVETARQLRKGETGVRTGLPHTPDELGQIAGSFDEMGTLLETRNDRRMPAEQDLMKVHDELEAKVEIITAELASANERLRISEAWYGALFENAIDPICLFRENRFTDCNESALKAFGCRKDEIVGNYPCFFAPPIQPDGTDSRQEASGRMANALSGTPQVFEWTHRRGDGTVFEAEVSLNRIEVGEEVLVLAMVRDITIRKAAERALHESAYFQQQLIDALPAPVYYKDSQGRYTGSNKAFESFLNVDKEKIIGKTVFDIAPGELAEVYHEIDMALLRDPGGWIYESSCTLADGSVHDMIFHKASFPLPDGSAGGLIGAIVDITGRRRAEQELRISEERFKILFKFAPDPFCLTDLNGKILDGNRAAESIVGCAREELIGKNLRELDLLPSENISRLFEALAQGLPGQPTGPDQFSLIRKDGTRVFLEIRSFPTAIEGQTLVLHIARDITSRKQTEEALKESQQQLADIIDFLPDATFVIDRTGHVLAWNRAMEEMLGIKAADMLGKGDYEYAIPFYCKRRPVLINLVLDPREEHETNFSNIKRKGNALSAETFIPSLKGTPAYLFLTASALYDSSGNVAGAIESIRDITERKIMEEAVARAEEKYRDIFENSVTGIYQVGRDGHFLRINNAIAVIHGYDSAADMLNEVRDSRDLFVHPERISEFTRLIVEQGSVRDFEVEFFKKDKSVVWVSLNVRAVRDPTGRLEYCEGTASDITDSKLLRAHLGQAQKLEAIGTLAGGVAHDFNNILAPIIGYTELSLNMLHENGRLSHNMRQVLLAANRARDLVRQILAFSRNTEQEQKPVQVSLIVKEALNLLRSSLPSTIDIRQAIREDAVHSTATANPTQIHQVFMNLCTNAAHAMREKGGTLTVTLDNVEIGPRTRKGSSNLAPGPCLRLSVSDTGHGMDKALKQRIFDPYFTTKGPDEGTGLGLAVVYGIVKNLSGAITVRSTPGDGTTFDVFFPKTGTIPPPPIYVSAPLPTGHGLILVVDDEKYIVDMVGEMLETLGYKAVPRYSSSDALEAFRARPDSFDLVITDMTMPHMTGTELAREIFAIRSETPLILCTGFSENVDENKIKPLGIRELLMKPVSMRDLAVAVNKVLAVENGKEK